MRPLQERKNEIASLATEELRRRFTIGGFGELRSFVEAELEARDALASSTKEARAEARDDEAISIARAAARAANVAAASATEANRISRSNLTIAIIAMALATIATIAAAIIGVKFRK